MLICNVNVGDSISCLYPMNGNRNILKARKGFVEAKGTGPKGDYVKVQLTDGTYRTFSAKRMVDVAVGA